MSDKRLFLVRNIEAFETSGALSVDKYEFEVLADCSAHGRAQNGPYLLIGWDIADQSTGRSLVLRMANHVVEQGKPTKSGFFHGTNVPGEFVAVASTLTRRRMRLGALLRINDLPVRAMPESEGDTSILRTGNINLTELGKNIEVLRVMRIADQEPFILACRFYQLALEQMENRADLAYLSLVSAIEVLSSRHAAEPATEADLGEDVRADLDAVPDRNLRGKLLEHLLANQYKVVRNFVAFVQAYVDESFWSQSKAKVGRVRREEFEKVLKRIYNQRSKTLHTGEPFPPNLFGAKLAADAEIDERTEIVVDGRRWTASQYLPYVDFFERLVQHVIVGFMRRSADAAQSDKSGA